MKYSIVLSIILLQSLAAFTQERGKLNELWKAYGEAREDTARVKLLVEEIGYYYEDFDQDSAIAVYKMAIDICDRNLSTQSPGMEMWGVYNSYKAIAQRYTGIVNRYLGNYDKALSCYNGSVNIYDGLIPDCDKYNNCADVKYSKAGCFNNIGVVYKSQGAYNKSAESFLKALAVYEEMSLSKDSLTAAMGNSGYAGCSNNIGLLYTDQGLYDKAEDFLNRSLTRRIELNDKFGVGQCYNNLGNLYHTKGGFAAKNSEKNDLFKKALENFTKSEEIYNEMALTKNSSRSQYYAKRGISDCLGNMGIIHKSFGEYSKALELYERSLANRTDLGDKMGIAAEYCNISAVYMDMADKDPSDTTAFFMAKGCAEKAYQTSDETGAIPEQKNALRHLAVINEGMKRDNKAEEFFIQLLDLDFADILLNFSFISEKDKEDYFNTISIDFTEFYSFALKRKIQNPAITGYVYNNTVRTKGLLLKSSTAMRNAILNSGSKSLISLYEDWLSAKKDVSKLYTAQKSERLEGLKKAEEKADSLERELAQRSQMFSDFGKLQSVTWEGVRNNLLPGEAAIEFIRFRLKTDKMSKFSDTTLYCALIVKPGCLYPEMIPLFDEKDLKQMLEKQGADNVGFFNRLYKQKPYDIKGLYELVWAPMNEYLKDVKKIYYSPDGLLHKINFQAIATTGNLYLSDLYDMDMQSSTGGITLADEGKPLPDLKTRVSLFGGIDYNASSTVTTSGWEFLEGTLAETDNIAHILNKKNIELQIFKGSSATEDTLKLIAGNSDYLHIATHGFFYPEPGKKQGEKQNEEKAGTENIKFRGGDRGFGAWTFVTNTNPLMRSGLVMAGANKVWTDEEKGNGEDGVLTAQEVTAIDMRNTQLLVLSACETGLGDIKGSEGVYGLQRAFKMAGVKYIIMSLWQVPDKETVEFMELFYKKLLKSKDVRKSFNETQKEMRKNYDPYFWAAFVLIE